MRSAAAGQQYQRGFAALMLLIVVVAALGVLAFSVQTRTLDRLGHTQAGQQAARLDRLAAAVTAVYRRSAATLDANAAAPLGCAQLLAAASPDAADLVAGARLQCALGSRRQTADGSLAWRSIWLWLPDRDAAVDATVYDAATDTLTPAPGVVWRHVDGRAVQSALLSESLDRFGRLGRQLRSFYRARAATAPASDADRNFWALAPCTGVPAAALTVAPACTAGGYAAAAGALAGIGMPASDATDAWGQAFEFQNSGAGVSATTIPYSARTRMTTPWGFVVEREVRVSL